jgi:hypothetical protein
VHEEGGEEQEDRDAERSKIGPDTRCDAMPPATIPTPLTSTAGPANGIPLLCA